MKIEKVIAILVSGFTTLTNIFLILPLLLFVVLLSGSLGEPDFQAIFRVIVGFACIVFSFIFNMHFGKAWFYRAYNHKKILELWVISIIHYLLFPIYTAWFFDFEKAIIIGSCWFFAFISIPLVLSIIGFSTHLNLRLKTNKQTQNPNQLFPMEIKPTKPIE